MRVYLPTTTAGLAVLRETGEVAADGPIPAHAATADVRAELPGSGDDELEFLALSEAAAASLALLARTPAALARRVVLAADVADSDVVPDPDGSAAAVLVTGPVPLRLVAAVHVDEPAAADDVAAAAGGSAAAAASVADRDLLWYASQEIPDLLDG